VRPRHRYILTFKAPSTNWLRNNHCERQGCKGALGKEGKAEPLWLCLFINISFSNLNVSMSCCGEEL
jgi:hypothetical protein